LGQVDTSVSNWRFSCTGELGQGIEFTHRDSRPRLVSELFEQLDELNDSSLTGVFHCFTGGMPEAEKILSYGGFKLGIGGVVTFKKSGLAEVLNNIPIEHIILETDSPYLAPTPYRGKRNESAYVRLVAEKLAEVYACEVEEIARPRQQCLVLIFKMQRIS
jgi:TatD DNase family protein